MVVPPATEMGLRKDAVAQVREDKHQMLTHFQVLRGTRPSDFLLTCLPGSSPFSVKAEQDPVTRAKGVRKEAQKPNLQLSENGESCTNDNKTSGKWNRRVDLQHQYRNSRKCEIFQPKLMSGSEGFNYWWHWLICMKHLLSNVTYAHPESCRVETTFLPCA